MQFADKIAAIPRLVHLDLKGAPPKISYLRRLLPLLSYHKVSGLLIEYEDTFPYQGDLSILAAKHAYNIEDLKQFIGECAHFNIAVIPLVQTFGHIEFVLKHDTFAHLREKENYPNSLCPSKPDSFSLISAMIEQIASFHSTSPAIHIGCDEVYQLGVCNDCQRRMSDRVWSRTQLFAAHVNRVATHAKSVNPSLRVLIWDDMLRGCDLTSLESSRLKESVEPMVWFYGVQGFPDVWNRYSAVFPTIWCASAFKGASGPTAIIPDLSLHVANHQSWQAVINDNATRVNSFGGFVLTGWSRYDHFGVLCELLPSSLPSLVLCLTILNHGEFTPETHAIASKKVGYPEGSLISLSEPRAMPCVDLSRSLPGSAVWLTSIRQANLYSSFKQFVDSDLYRGWFHERNIVDGRISRGMVDQLLHQVEQMILEYEKLISESQRVLPEVFDEAICEEWIDIHCTIYLHKLRKISHKMKLVMQCVR